MALAKWIAASGDENELLTQGDRTHPLNQLLLAGWLLSTDITKRQTFLSRVEKSSWQHGERTPLVPTRLLGLNGIVCVVNGLISIPFHHL